MDVIKFDVDEGLVRIVSHFGPACPLGGNWSWCTPQYLSPAALRNTHPGDVAGLC